MNNLIEVLNRDLDRHLVSVKLPGDQEEKILALIVMRVRSSKLDDFRMTYGVDVTEFHIKVATKLFGEEETANEFGVFVDSSQQMIFAFSLDFADYDTEKKAVVYKDIDSILMDSMDTTSAATPPRPEPPPRRRTRWPGDEFGGGGGTIRYSLSEKDKAEASQ